jgi:hypothetical protein
MVSDERFYLLVKRLLHRITDLEVEMVAMQVVLKANFHEDFYAKVQAVAREFEERPTSKAHREAIDQVEFSDALNAFEKHQGTVQ